MAVRNQRRKKPKTCRVQLAIGALEGSVHPLDLDVRNLDLAPTSLDLPDTQEAETCSNPRCSRPAVDVCSKCGSPLCEECAGLSGTEG